MTQWERASQTGAWTDRFEVRRKIAAGSFGVVYLAHDRQRGLEVALKVLREATTGVDLYRFKREFRGLADIVHPNLVTLHELHHTGEQWLFTMEYVPGGSFLDWVRPRLEPAALAEPMSLAQAARRPKAAPERRSAGALARAVAKRLDKEQVPWSLGFAKVLRAGAANLNDQPDEAQGQLREAIEVFSSAHLVLYANVARRCLGLLVGGDEGRLLVEHAEAWMAAEGIRVPAAVCAVFAPGCAAEV